MCKYFRTSYELSGQDMCSRLEWPSLSSSSVVLAGAAGMHTHLAVQDNNTCTQLKLDFFSKLECFKIVKTQLCALQRLTRGERKYLLLPHFIIAKWGVV